jgi:hypothetical protein
MRSSSSEATGSSVGSTSRASASSTRTLRRPAASTSRSRLPEPRRVHLDRQDVARRVGRGHGRRRLAHARADLQHERRVPAEDLAASNGRSAGDAEARQQPLQRVGLARS